MKKCPFCGKENCDDAIKCKFCGKRIEITSIWGSIEQTAMKNTGPKTSSSHDDFQNKPVGFGWGKLWIFMGFLQGGIAFIFGFIFGITTEYIPNRPTGLIIGVLGIGSAIGLLKRKKFGLYLVYLILALAFIVGLVYLLKPDLLGLVTEEHVVIGAIYIVIQLLWFRYFWRRRNWFS